MLCSKICFWYTSKDLKELNLSNKFQERSAASCLKCAEIDVVAGDRDLVNAGDLDVAASGKDIAFPSGGLP